MKLLPKVVLDARESGRAAGKIADRLPSSTRGRAPMRKSIPSPSAGPGPLRRLLPLFLAVAAVLVANGVLATVVPLQLHAAGEGLGLAGLVSSSFPLGLIVGYLGASRIVARVGQLRGFRVLCACAAIATLSMVLWGAPVLWIFARCATGFAVAGIYLVVEGWITADTPLRHRAVAIAAYMVTCQLAMATGQALAGGFELSRAQGFGLAALLYTSAAVPVARMATPPCMMRACERISCFAVLRRTPMAMVGIGAAGMTIGSLLNLGPLILAAQGHDAQAIVRFMSSFVLGGLLLQWPIARLPVSIDRRAVLNVLAAGTLMASVVAMGSVATHAAAAWLPVTAALLGACCFVAYPVSLALAHSSFAERQAVGVTCTLLIVYGLGSLAGPLVVSALLDWGQATSPWLAIAAIQVVLLSTGVYRLSAGLRVSVRSKPEPLPVALPQTLPSGAQHERSGLQECGH